MKNKLVFQLLRLACSRQAYRVGFVVILPSTNIPPLRGYLMIVFIIVNCLLSLNNLANQRNAENAEEEPADKSFNNCEVADYSFYRYLPESKSRKNIQA